MPDDGLSVHALLAQLTRYQRAAQRHIVDSFAQGDCAQLLGWRIEMKIAKTDWPGDIDCDCMHLART